MKNYEDKIYSLGETVTGQTQAMSQAVQKTLENNGGVGIMTGSYDQNLSILSVDNLLLHSTGYTFDTFMEQTEYSCAVTPQIRQAGNRLSGLAETAYASLLA